MGATTAEELADDELGAEVGVDPLGVDIVIAISPLDRWYLSFQTLEFQRLHLTLWIRYIYDFFLEKTEF